LPLWRRLRVHGGDACGAGRHGCHHAAIEEVVFAAGVELPLVDGPPAERWTILRNGLYGNARRATRGAAIATGRCDLNGAAVAAWWG
jgi:hypothetical protein